MEKSYQGARLEIEPDFHGQRMGVNRYEMSSGQKRIFFIENMQEESTTYNFPRMMGVQGLLDLDRLQAALDLVVKRHEVLRTRFLTEDGVLIQKIEDDIRIPVEYDEAEKGNIGQIFEKFITPFQLDKAPLARVKIIKTNTHEMVMMLDMHHIITDDISTHIFLYDLAKFYNGERLAELKLQYKDYSMWQNRQDYSRQKEYWLNQFSEAIPILDLKTDFTRPQMKSYKGSYVITSIQQQQKDKLKELCRANGVSEDAVLLSAFMVLLHHYSRQNEIVVGNPVWGRKYQETEDMMGMFANYLAIKGVIRENQRFLDFLQETQTSYHNALENQEYPFDELVENLKLARDLSRNPIFDVMLFLEDEGDSTYCMGEASLAPLEYDSHVAKLDLMVRLKETAQGYAVTWEYNTDLFLQKTVERMGAHFCQLIINILENPNQAISDLRLLTPKEEQQVLYGFNQTQTDYPKEKTIIELFEEQVEKNPESIAVVSGEAQITYAQLNNQANYLGNFIREKGIRPDDFVGILASRELNTIVGIIGILKSGAAYLPLDPKLPRERMNYILADSQCKVLLADDVAEGYIDSSSIELLSIRGNDNSCPELAGNLEKVNASSRDLAYLLYTSGTTGEPKGVMIEQRSVIRLVKNTNFFDFTDVRILQTGSLTFDASTFEIWGALLNGGSLFIVDEEVLTSPKLMRSTISKHRINTLWLTVALYNQMISMNHTMFDELTHLLIGGDKVSETHVRLLKDRNKKICLINGYGPTESTTFTTTYEIGHERLALTPIGKPIANTTVYILNGTVPCGIGVPGELCIGGDGLSRGYLNAPELTAEKYIDNPFIKGEKLYKSGDLARWNEDGNIEYLGRIDEQVKIRGFRIELTEIENKLRELAEVEDAAVTVRDEGGSKYLCGYVVGSADIDTNEIRQRLSASLPDYMIPASIMVLAKLPLNKNGKVDKKALPKIDFKLTTKYVPARNELEACASKIFKDILGTRQVGIDDNFFELGGDSIKAIRIVSKLRKQGYEVSVPTILKSKTIRELFRHVKKIEFIDLDQGEFSGTVAFTPIQKDFFHSKLKVPHHFNQAFIIASKDRIAKDIFEEALKKLPMHHDMLRAVYREDRQVVLPIKDSKLCDIQYFDFSDLAEGEELYQKISSQSAEIQKSIDLSEGPLFVAGVYRTKITDYVLLCIHHLVVDGVSWRILLEDLNSFYLSLKNNKTIELPTKTLSFSNWGKELARYRESYLLNAEIPYWKRAEELISQSRIKPSKPGDGYVLEKSEMKLSKGHTKQLLFDAGKAYNTEINDLLIASLGRAVNRLTGLRTVSINMEGHGRESIGKSFVIDRTVGWFTSVYPLAIENIGNTIEEDIRTTKEQIRRIPNRGIGYGVLKSYGEPVLNGQRPDITFNYLGEFDQEAGEKDSFVITDISYGERSDSRNQFGTSITITASVVKKELVIVTSYNTAEHSEAFITELEELFKASLIQVLEHCASLETIEHTASDFGELLWNDKEYKTVKEAFEESGYQIERIYPLTNLQEGMLFHKLEDEESTNYVVQDVFKLESKWDEALLRSSLELLAKKHEVLRTSIVYRNVGEPRQVLLRGREIEYQTIDLSSEADSQTKFEEIKSNDVKRGFDLQSDSLFRITIVKLNEDTSYMLVGLHHIIVDGWCLPIILDDLLSFYDELHQGKSFDEVSKNLEDGVRYEDYVRLIQSKDKQLGYEYWQTLLDGYDEKIGIPSQGQADPSDDEVETVLSALTKEESNKLKDISKTYGVTVNTVIEASWGILLQRYNHVNDVVFGKVVSGRNVQLQGLESMVGLFINTIPARVESKNERFAELLIYLQQQAIDSNPYEYCSLSEIQKQSSLGSDLFDTLVEFDNYYIFNKNAENTLQLELLEAREQTNYPLTLFVSMKEVLDIGLMYDSNKYGKAEAENIVSRLKTILLHVIKNPEVRVDEIELLLPQEKAFIIEDINNTNTDFSRDKTVIELFEEQASRVPDEIAVASDDETLTYSQLNRRANQLGARLRSMGIRPDDFVGIIAERKASTIVGILGILKSGGAYLPIDPKNPIERVRYIIKDSGLKALLMEQEDERYAAELVEIVSLSSVEADTIVADDNLEKINTSNDLAYLIYTSGTTGEPKGVMIEQKSINRLVKNTNYADFSNVRILQTGSLTFDASTFEIWGALLNGGSVYVVDEDVLMDSHLLEQTMKRFQINTMFITTALFNQLIGLNEHIFDSLSQLLFGGEATSEEHVRKLWESNKEIRFSNVYGPTETTTFATYYPISEASLRVKTPIGKPISNTTAYVFSGKTLSGIGMPGELCIGGEGLSRGYLNSEHLNHNKYFDNPYQPGERLYRTGDLVRWGSDGNIEFLGRIDEQVKIRGFRIELKEVESKLRALEIIENAAVIVREHNGSKYLCGYVVGSGQINIKKVKRRLSEILPDYMVPTYIMQVEKFTLNKNGKIDRKQLPEPEYVIDREYILPRNETEATLIKVLEEILVIEHIGIDDSFFDLGGDSIKAIRITSKMREAGYEVRVKDIVQRKTVRKIAKVIKRLDIHDSDNSEVTGPVELTPIQKEFFSYNLKVPHYFNQSFIYESKERIQDDKLGQALKAIVKHHDMLRAVYDGQAQKIVPIKESSLFELKCFDYQILENQEEAYQLIIEQSNEIQASISLAKGPLMKAGLFHMKDSDFVMLCIHHLAVDGVSWRIIAEDLESGYRAAKAGKSIVLPDKTTSFQRWSEALGKFRNSYTLEKEIPYWKDIEEQVLESKFEDRGQTVGLEFAEQVIELDKETTKNLLHKSGQAYHTEINDLLLTALFRAVHQVSGQDTMAVLMEGHGRESLDEPLPIDRTVGWFTSTYPVAIKTVGVSLREDIRKVKEVLRRIPNHGFGYGLLKHLGSPALNGINPEITFNYLGEFGKEDSEKIFKISQIDHGRAIAEENVYGTDIAMDAIVVNHKFKLTITYNQEKYISEFIEKLGMVFERQLHAVIDHCMASKSTHTASDFGELGWSDLEFVRVEENLKAKGYSLERIYPLTGLQEGMLFHKLIDKEATSYVVQSVYKIESALDEDILKESLELLGEKHEILRSSIVYKNVREPRQVLLAGREIEYHSIDISAESNPYQKFMQIKDQDVKRGFDLENDSLLRVLIVKVNQDESYMIMNIHHIIIDGWSNSIMMNDLLNFYDELSNGMTAEDISGNIEKGIRFEEYVNYIQNKNKEPGHLYWRELLDGYEETVGIHPDGDVDDTDEQAETVRIQLLAEETRALEGFSRKHEVTINTLIETAWGILLQKYNNTKDVVFGKVVSGRNANIQGIENLVGLFINTVPVRVEANCETFSALVTGMQQQAIKGNLYEDCPLSEIQNESRHVRELFDTLMVFENYYVQDVNTENKLKLVLDGEREQTNYPLTLFSYMEDNLHLGLMYDTSKYGRVQAERIISQMKTILLNALANADVRLEEIELLTNQEKDFIINVFNHTKTNYPEHKTIMELFEEQVARVPDEVAVVCEGEKITYSCLNERANQLGARLRALGVKPNEFVGIVAERKISTIAGIAGILKAGGAYLPIDPKSPVERVHYILKDSGCKVLLMEKGADIFDVHGLADVIAISEDKSVNGSALVNLNKVNTSRDLAYLIYTSGTTGEPKGVMIEQRSVSRLVKATNYLDFTNVRILQTGSLTFDASTFEIWGALLNGGSVYIVDEDVLMDVHLLEKTLKQYDVNAMFITTALYNQLISMNERIFDSLDQLLFGGEATSEEHVRRLWERNKKIRLSNVYGPTETTTFATYYPIKGDTLRAKTPIGKPIANTTAYIFNGRTLSGIGIPGELCLGGAGLSRGYLNSEQLTKDKFFDNPYQPGERLYRTGDLARWNQDGNIEFLGRIDEQVKIRGFRIEPGEIESRLRDIERIEDAAVIMRENGGSKYLCGYVVSKGDISADQIKHQLNEVLPDYMVPNYIMNISALPLNKNGKIDKKALPEPDLAAATMDNYIEPRNETEICLVKVFKEILGITQVGIDDNFFDLGGDSIKAIRIVSRMREEGYKVTVKSIIKNKTISQISKLVKSDAAPVNLTEVTGIVKFTPIQKEFALDKIAAPDHFNQSFVLKSEKKVDGDVLGLVLKEIAIHHDMLRAVYDGKTQRILSSRDSKLYELIEEDYTAVASSDEVYNRIDQRSDKIQRSMDLANGPLFKVGLFHTPGTDYIMMCAHHFVIDGISWRIIAEDLVKGYNAAKEGLKIVFPSKTVSFQAWSEALEAYRESYVLKREIPYWQDIEQKVKAADFKGDMNGSVFTLAEQRIVLTEEYTSLLVQKAGKAYQTEINDLLLTALFRAVRKELGKETVAVLMEGHGRESLDVPLAIDRTVGWFTSTYPVAVKGLGKTIREDIRDVKEMLRRIPNRGLGYGVLKELGEDVLTGQKPKILFNFLGEFDQEDTTDDFRVSNIKHGAYSSIKNSEGLEIAVNGLIKNKKLYLPLTYDRAKYSDGFIARLQANFEQQLLDIIHHCIEADTYHTASDLGELSWSDEEFTALDERFRASGYIMERIYPLTGLQEGMLFHKLQDEQGTSYVVQQVYRIEDGFNEPILRASFRLLADKHEVLRTSIVYDGVSVPRQVLLHGRETEFHVADISNEADIVQKRQEIIEQDVKRGFDLENDSLLRITILKENENSHTFIMSFHHIIIDGWCMSILMNDLQDIYQQLCLGKSIEEVRNSLQKGVRYEDYVRYIQNKDKNQALEYWKDLLRGYDDRIGILPQGKPDRTEESVKTIRVSLDEELSKKLEEVSKEYQVTVNTVIEAAWGILLQKYNNTDDVVFGKVVSGRNAEMQGIEEAVGLFINSIPIRVESDDMSFAEILLDLQQQALNGSIYDDCPLSEIQRVSGLGREMFNTLLVFENYYSQDGSGDDRLKLIFEESREETNYPLTLYAYLEEGLELGLMYDTNIYGKGEAERILNRLKAVLSNVIENPQMKIGG